MRRALRCYAERDGDTWEAVCLDLDIAVHGRSFLDVYQALTDAIRLYVDSMSDLPEQDRRRLLNRPAPLGLRLKFAWLAIRSVLRSRTDEPSGAAEFMVSAPV